MRFVSSVTFDEVQREFRREHPVARQHQGNTNQDTENCLELADKSFGRWSEVRLCRADVLDVMLPWHLSEGGAYEMVPRTGLTVGQAARIVRARGTEWAGGNPVCTAKLDLFRDSAFTSLYLSTRPVPHDHYADVRVGDGFIHLDGLHRMVAWELSGRLPAGEELTAFIAGDISSRATTGGQRT
ncbi:DUF6309 family protein [Streptomyces varsoviensis]|uniref:ParB/Sulfiredoxin domain-containing protein n=1 Tax=Streptomyces varsoviensis TaxID=67373 RepID=A0ABR5ITV2_9ACTN|nr:DUF6309 family protein [Streptomyces varsoviensis]KOG66327.1 hypothetical protein ADK38_41475 [Streptomyces varsoviensis]